MNPSLDLVKLGSHAFAGAGLDRVKKDQPGPQATDPQDNPYEMKYHRNLKS
jgi:hypothetical protein